jgi:CRP/FNR family transcriptional regulator
MSTVRCSTCKVRKHCLPADLSPQQLERVEEMVATRRTVKRGATLVHEGEKFTSLYAIRTGFFKTQTVTEDGREQVIGFQMAGEYIGLDGIVDDTHTCDAVALEDADVCVIPLERMEAASREVSALQRHMLKTMSHEIVRKGGVMLLLGGMRAEERIASFLLNLTQRLHARGYSPSELVLRMTREEIGSYLCLKLETVSRAFSKFAAQGVLQVKLRHVHILDVDALEEMTSFRTPIAWGRSQFGATYIANKASHAVAIC